MFKAQLNKLIVSQIKHFGPHKVLVLDNVFNNADDMRSYAIAHEAQFKPPPKGSYPGLVLSVNFADDCFRTLYRQEIAHVFSTVPVVKAKHRLGVTCVPEHQLSKIQAQPHTDIQQSSKHIRYLAAVTYLFDQPQLGGTGFYSDCIASDQVVSERVDARDNVASLPSKEVGDLKYITSSTNMFRLDGVSSAAYNRMIVFESTKLHSGHLQSPSLLSSNICSGRLTLNSFFTSLILPNSH